MSDKMEDADGGWQFTFLEDIDVDFNCIICLLPMKEPHQISSCGHSMCKTCLEKVICRDPICPQDRKPIERSAIFPDLKCKRKIMALKIKCQFSDVGCEWHGELNDFLKNHSGKCLKEPVPCTMELCTAQPTREELPSHLESECEWRIIKCEYCSVVIPFCVIQDHLDNTCHEYPIFCKNVCGITIQRKKMESHLEECQRRLVQCQYQEVGCNELIMAKDIELHMESNARHHTDQLFAAFQNEKRGNKMKTEKLTEELTVETRNLRKDYQYALEKLKKDNQSLRKDYQDALEKLKKDNQTLRKDYQDALEKLKNKFDTILQINIGDIEPGHVEFIWYIEDFQWHRLRSQDDSSYEICSPTYQTGLRGYHFRLTVDLNLEGVYVSVQLKIMQGPHDDVLPWPCKLSREITLINCDRMKDIVCKDSEWTDDDGDVLFPKPSMWDDAEKFYDQFIKRNDLFNRGYIINDSVIIKLKLQKFNKK